MPRWAYCLVVVMEGFQIFWLIYYQVICRNGFANNKLSRMDVTPYIPNLVTQL